VAELLLLWFEFFSDCMVAIAGLDSMRLIGRGVVGWLGDGAQTATGIVALFTAAKRSIIPSSAGISVPRMLASFAEIVVSYMGMIYAIAA